MASYVMLNIQDSFHEMRECAAVHTKNALAAFSQPHHYTPVCGGKLTTSEAMKPWFR